MGAGMRTVKQVSSLTGVSVRTLQYYDEIGLFKPTQVTEAGYRLYDDASLGILQQILFFRELDFSLKEIKAIMEHPQFDRVKAFKRQRELIQMKRDRLNRLLNLLERLEKGEKIMSFKEFDLQDYFQAMESFKKTHTDEIIQRFGNLEEFDEMVEMLRGKESEIAQMAVKQYGSIDSFVRASEKNLKSFLEEGERVDWETSTEKTEKLMGRLTADLTKEVSSDEIQEILRELIKHCNQSNEGVDVGEHYWEMMADQYLTNPLFISATDKKYGEGAANYIGRAIKVFLG